MTIDRLSQGRRPEGPCVMHHLWHDLLFLHWEVPVEQLQKLVPPHLTIDTYEGRAYIGLVPFRISEIKHPSLSPVPGFSQFPEINVRTYVHLDGTEPGVWFFSLDAANPFACLAARVLYKLPYYFAKMSQFTPLCTDTNPNPTTEYRIRRHFAEPNAPFAAIDYCPCGQSEPTIPGTLDHFLLERYLLYSTKSEKIFVGQVHHKPYHAQQASVSRLEESLVQAAGISRPKSEPIIHFCRGVSVDIFSIKPVIVLAGR